MKALPKGWLPEPLHSDLDIGAIVDALKSLYDNAYLAYRPLVEDICSRDVAGQNFAHANLTSDS